MSLAESYLKTQRAAKALGVSVSTVKRWVDAGLLRAARTQGKHRLIPMSEAYRLAREQGLKIAEPEVLEALGTGSDRGAIERSLPVLEQQLRSGQVDEARRLVVALYESGSSAVMLADRLLHPVMSRIGHAWQVGSLDVYQEHQATRAMESALGELNQRLRSQARPGGPLALGATPSGDPYTLPCMLAELVLRELGFEVRNLGVNLPLISLARSIEDYRPALVFLSVSHLHDEVTLVAEFSTVERAIRSAGAALIVGGRALHPELRTRLVYAAYGECMAHLAEFARACVLAPRKPPGASQDPPELQLP